MDWDTCIQKRIVKTVLADRELAFSLRNIAKQKILSADALPAEMYVGKIVLLYDALRECLECIAIDYGYKIYNHECYGAFIKEILQQSRERDIFDKLRKIRNGINYYGQMPDSQDAEEIVSTLKSMIDRYLDHSIQT